MEFEYFDEVWFVEYGIGVWWVYEGCDVVCDGCGYFGCECCFVFVVGFV